MLTLLISLLTSLAFQESPERNASSPTEQLQALQKDLDSASREYESARDEAESDEDQKKRSGDRYRERANTIADRALELAREHPDDPAAFDALIWTIEEVRLGAERALKAIARDYIMSERLVDACRMTAMAPRDAFEGAETLLRDALAKSPHREVRGFACLYLAEHLKERANDVRHLEQNPKDAERFARDAHLTAGRLKQYRARGTNDLISEAAALYERAIANYGDLKTLRKLTLGQIAEGELFDLRQLFVGKEAPEIVGQDADGLTMRLSDHRGKVVVLTFSGEWCGPCRRMYPYERELVERLKGEPFALVSVTNDEDRATLRKAIQSGEITWRCWWDAGRDGPISSHWGINRWPTVFVLDDKGVIRHRNLHDEKLDRAVDELLEELKSNDSRD